MNSENLNDSPDALLSLQRKDSYSEAKENRGRAREQGRVRRRRWLGAMGMERALNACFGFRREAWSIGAIFVVELRAALAENGAHEGQLLLVALTEGTDVQMRTHAQSHVPGQRPVHRIGQQL